MNDLRDILERLVSFPSLTPDDAGCQDYMIGYLSKLGFQCQKMDQGPVSNFFASYGQSPGPSLVFAGHTDVVPIGQLHHWHSDPFTLTENKGLLYGRGTADMKGSLAAMLSMAKHFTDLYPSLSSGRLGFLITSGEEGDHYHLGTPYVMEQLKQQGIHIDYCVVGEPSSTAQVGDVIKIGRRGSLNAKITILGKQGHVAYPHLADNAIHKVTQVLAELTNINWDKGNDYFPPTSMQITSIQAGGHASNIIPGELNLQLNFRFSTEQTEQGLKDKVLSTFKKHHIQPTIEWRLSGNPFLTPQGKLLESSQNAINHITGISPELSTSGGTSDGRFIAPYGVEVIELGPINATIHQVNECVSLNDLSLLEEMYFSISKQLLIQ